MNRDTALPTIPQADTSSEFFAFVDSHPELTQKEIGQRFGLKQSAVSRRITARKRLAISTNGDRPETPPVETTSLQRVEIMGEPVSSAAQDYAALRSRLDALEAHRLKVDARLATLQAQIRETAQTYAELRSADMRSDTQDYAEPTWDDPDDAKSVPFNLSLPRGLKRLLDAEAKRTGLPASRLVQRWMLAQLNGKGVQDA
jgi:hypothetical protein